MSGRPDGEVAAALRHCGRVTRQRARNFYYGLKLLPESKRWALYALYAWMRRADDLADDEAAPPARRLDELETFRRRTDAALGGRPEGADPIWVALADTSARFDLTADHLHAVLDGQLDDLHQRRYETFEELREYCLRVASAVGLLCIEVWGYQDEAAPGLAVDRGLAFQLTNIVRDFAQDFDGDRVYFPDEDFKRHGLKPAQLRSWADPEACGAFIMEQIERAGAYYERSAGLETMISADCRPTLWAMTRIYRALLDQASADPARIVRGRRLRVRSWQKAAIAVRARSMVREPAVGLKSAGA